MSPLVGIPIEWRDYGNYQAAVRSYRVNNPCVCNRHHRHCFCGAEIDNAVIAVGPPDEANIGNLVNGENIFGQDVVFWFGAHFTEDLATHCCHIVGPHLVPQNW